MKLQFILILGAVLVEIALGQVVEGKGQGETSKVPIKEELIANGIDFLTPFQSEIEDWFWRISGVLNPNQSGKKPKSDFLNCDLCSQALPALRELVNLNITEDFMVEIATVVCNGLDIGYSHEICRPTILSYVRPVLFLISNRTDLSIPDICGIINPGCGEVSPKLINWKINIDKNKPNVLPRPEVPSNTEFVKILQFTDIHLDLDYVEGTGAICDLPICCRDVNGPGPNATWTAGKFGHIRCGLPTTALDAMYTHANSTHQDTEFIFLTGDYVHSGVWLYSAEENGRHIEYVTQKLADSFPNTVIYPLTGNHEPDVVNMYPPIGLWDKFDLSWMYANVSAPFEKHLGPIQLRQFKRYGYYTVTPKKYPKLRIIALNTNLCYIDNLWLPYDPIDTGGQLQWFANELAYAEKDGQHVLVIGHIQPGSGSCWPVWSNQFNRIINRYEHIIRAQFYGHSHEQYYTLAMEEGTNRPISVSFVAGSGLTDGMNSAYNVYHVDGKRELGTWEILNQETYVLNLNKSNKAEAPIFERILNAKVDFGVKSMRPENIYDLADRMICDDKLYLKYNEVKAKGNESNRFDRCTTFSCRAGVLGEIVTSNSANNFPYFLMENEIKNRDCKATTRGPDQNSSPMLNTGTFIIYSLFFLAVINSRIFN